MGVIINRKIDQFATSGFYAKRCNPDRTMATGQRTLGFKDTIDITSVLDTSDAATLLIKVGNGPWQSKSIDFTGSSPSALTVSAAVTLLNGAGFSGCTFAVDSATHRLLLKATSSTEKEIQIYGYLAGALHFGNCRAFQGLGCYYLDYITRDDTVSIAQAVNKDDNEKIEQEGSHGTKTIVVIAGNRNGEDLTITTKPLDFEFQQMVQGGRYKKGTSTEPVEYAPPLPGERLVIGPPLMTIVKVDPLYTPNIESTMGQDVAIRTALYYSAIGSVGDESNGAKSLVNFTATFSAGVYVDESGVEHSNPLYHSYTKDQWESLNLVDLIKPPDEIDGI
jgi:hypothetical protein